MGGGEDKPRGKRYLMLAKGQWFGISKSYGKPAKFQNQILVAPWVDSSLRRLMIAILDAKDVDEPVDREAERRMAERREIKISCHQL